MEVVHPLVMPTAVLSKVSNYLYQRVLLKFRDRGCVYCYKRGLLVFLLLFFHLLLFQGNKQNK